MIRCPLPSSRHPLLPPLCLPRSFADALHTPWHPRSPQRQGRKHPFHPLLPGTLSPRPCWDSIPLSEDLFHEPNHCPRLHKVTHLQHCLSQSRWPTRLGHCSETSTACLDRPYSEPVAAVQCQAGSCSLGKYVHYRTRTPGTCRKRPDLSSASQSWRKLRSAS